MDLSPSPQQSQALDAVAGWLRHRNKPFFYLAGYAGVGKTSLARHFAEGVNGTVCFASFTGKAASVMRAKGCWEAKTIHSLIYSPREKSHDALQRLEEDLEQAQLDPRFDEDRIVSLKDAIAAEKKSLRSPHFELNPDSELRHAALLIVDEVSMCGQQMGEDLLSFQVPLLVLGDPAQLPPVRSAGFFTAREPDILLTEIHRQAADNPIIAMATTVREGRPLAYGRYGESSVVTKAEFKLLRDNLAPDVQVIVGRNETRRRANARRRAALGFAGALPEPGERLVCLRNNHEIGLLNGTIWKVEDSHPGGESGTVLLRITSEDGLTLVAEAHRAPFLGEEVSPWIRREFEELTYGYAITAHRAQGSQWDEVLVVDESDCFRQHAKHWLYTTLTRAVRKVVVVR